MPSFVPIVLEALWGSEGIIILISLKHQGFALGLNVYTEYKDIECESETVSPSVASDSL